MYMHVWERAHSHAYVGISLTHLKTEGEELGKDQRAPPSISAAGQPLSVIAKAPPIAVTSSARKIHIILPSYGCSMTPQTSSM